MDPQPPPPGRKRRLGEILTEAGLINALQLKAALSEQRKWGGKLGRTLVEMGFVNEESMTTALSRQLSLPQVDLDALYTAPEAIQLLRVDIAERYGVFPIAGDARQKTLQIATADPTNGESLQELAFNTGLRIQVAVATPSSIDRAIRRCYYGESTVASDTATPDSMGMEEVSLSSEDLIERSGGSTQAAARALQAAAQAAADTQAQANVVALEQRVQELTERLGALEKHAANQVRALRGLFDLLVEKGQITREEYQAKVRPRE